MIILLYFSYFGEKTVFQKYIFHYNNVKSYVIAAFQGTHLNELFETIQVVYSLKIALMQNFGLYLWRQIMLPLETNNLGKPTIQ